MSRLLSIQVRLHARGSGARANAKSLDARAGLGLLLGALVGLTAAAADLPAFPKPNPAGAFPALKLYGPDGRPFRTPVEDWAGARRRALEDPDWVRWVAAQRREVDDWIARRQDRVEWVAGWWHDFVSPKDGSFLTWTADEPGETTLASASDPQVKLTPKLHAAWVYGFRSRHAAKLEEAACLHRLTGEPRYADWVASQLDFYATNYTRWPAKPGRHCRLMWQSLDEAVNLVRFTRAVRGIEEAASPAQRQRWFEAFFRPQAAMLEGGFQFIHNIACWHRAAVAQVALSFGDDALWRQAVEGPFGIRQQLARGVTSDYLWFEQSLGYNSYVVSALRPFFEDAARAGRLGGLEAEVAVVQNLLLAPLALRFPTGQLPNPADATGGPGHAPNLAALAAAYRLYPTELGLREAARLRQWSTLLDPPTPGPAAPPLPPVASQNLAASGMAVLRQGEWQVFFHYGQIAGSHAQAEALNFEAFYGETDVTHDPGTVGYGSPLHAGYYTQGLAHNVPLVNGLGQARWHPGELLEFEAAQGRVAARQPAYRPEAAAERALRIEGSRLVDTTRVWLKAGPAAPARLGLALHLQGTVVVPDAFLPEAGFASTNRPGAFAYWSEPRTGWATNTLALEVGIGARRMQLTLQVPGRFSVTHARSPDVPPRQRESLYLETTGTDVTFTTWFQPATP